MDATRQDPGGRCRGPEGRAAAVATTTQGLANGLTGSWARLVAFGLLAALGTMGCPPPKRVPAVASDSPSLDYTLDLEVDPSRQELAVTAHVEARPPRSTFFLHPGLSIESLTVDGTPLGFTRDGRRVTLSLATSRFTVRYRGTLARTGPRDFKSHAWLEPNRIRLTEVTLWYPVFYDGPGDFPWPPEPARARLRVPTLPGLHWATTGGATGDRAFEQKEPGDLVVLAVPFAPRQVGGGSAAPSGYRVLASHPEALVSQLDGLLGFHAARLGALRRQGVFVVEFPDDGITNGLAFVSSGLAVFSATTCKYLVDGTPRAVQVASHELAHLWFGGELRATGEGARLLTEGFAEYYAWRVVRERFGESAIAELAESARRKSGELKVRPTYGWESERIYAVGPLALQALALRVGEKRIDDAVRAIHERGLPWSVETFFEQLGREGADPDGVAAYRREWDI